MYHIVLYHIYVVMKIYLPLTYYKKPSIENHLDGTPLTNIYSPLIVKCSFLITHTFPLSTDRLVTYITPETIFSSFALLFQILLRPPRVIPRAKHIHKFCHFSYTFKLYKHVFFILFINHIISLLIHSFNIIYSIHLTHKYITIHTYILNHFQYTQIILQSPSHTTHNTQFIRTHYTSKIIKNYLPIFYSPTDHQDHQWAPHQQIRPHRLARSTSPTDFYLYLPVYILSLL